MCGNKSRSNRIGDIDGFDGCAVGGLELGRGVEVELDGERGHWWKRPELLVIWPVFL
jgi:hypothetical protein